MTWEQIASLLINFGSIVVFIPIAVWMLFWLLRKRDNLLGLNFKEDIYDRIKTEPIALSIWLAAWLYAVSNIIAALLGKWA